MFEIDWNDQITYEDVIQKSDDEKNHLILDLQYEMNRLKCEIRQTILEKNREILDLKKELNEERKKS